MDATSWHPVRQMLDRWRWQRPLGQPGFPAATARLLWVIFARNGTRYECLTPSSSLHGATLAQIMIIVDLFPLASKSIRLEEVGRWMMDVKTRISLI